MKERSISKPRRAPKIPIPPTDAVFEQLKLFQYVIYQLNTNRIQPIWEFSDVFDTFFDGKNIDFPRAICKFKDCRCIFQAKTTKQAKKHLQKAHPEVYKQFVENPVMSVWRWFDTRKIELRPDLFQCEYLPTAAFLLDGHLRIATQDPRVVSPAAFPQLPEAVLNQANPLSEPQVVEILAQKGFQLQPISVFPPKLPAFSVVDTNGNLCVPEKIVAEDSYEPDRPETPISPADLRMLESNNNFNI